MIETLRSKLSNCPGISLAHDFSLISSKHTCFVQLPVAYPCIISTCTAIQVNIFIYNLMHSTDLSIRPFWILIPSCIIYGVLYHSVVYIVCARGGGTNKLFVIIVITMTPNVLTAVPLASRQVWNGEDSYFMTSTCFRSCSLCFAASTGIIC